MNIDKLMNLHFSIRYPAFSAYPAGSAGTLVADLRDGRALGPSLAGVKGLGEAPRPPAFELGFLDGQADAERVAPDSHHATQAVQLHVGGEVVASLQHACIVKQVHCLCFRLMEAISKTFARSSTTFWNGVAMTTNFSACR